MKTVFFDVDTQLDFLYPAGALYVPGAEEIVTTLGSLTRAATQKSIQIISTADAHTEDDAEFRTWKPHCVSGTVGQQKAAITLLNKPVFLSTQPKEIDSDLTQAPQIVVEKQMLDCFTNPNLQPLLDRLAADRYILYGVVSEFCVRCAAFGLLKTGARVELLTDAVKHLSPQAEGQLFDEFQAQGGHLTTTAQI